MKLGIIGFDTDHVAAPAHGFWILDEDRVMVETFSAELNLAQPQETSLYGTVFGSLAAVATVEQVRHVTSVLPEAADLKIVDITERTAIVSGLATEQPRYFLQHALGVTTPLRPWAPRSARLAPTCLPRTLADPRQYKTGNGTEVDRMSLSVGGTPTAGRLLPVMYVFPDMA